MKQQNALRLGEQKKTNELAEKVSRCDEELAKLANAKKAAYRSFLQALPHTFSLTFHDT